MSSLQFNLRFSAPIKLTFANRRGCIMGLFDFFNKGRTVNPSTEATKINQVISSTNNMIRMQLLITVTPSTTASDLFEDLFFQGYFYGIHDAAFQWTGHRKSSKEMYTTYLCAIADFIGATATRESGVAVDELTDLMSQLCSNEESPVFQEAQTLAGTEYFELMQGRRKSLQGLLNHFLPA